MRARHGEVVTTARRTAALAARRWGRPQRQRARRVACVPMVLGLLLAVPMMAPAATVELRFTGQEPQMPDRLFRDGDGSTCEMADFPGEFAGPAYWRSARFCPPPGATCLTATFDEGTCGDDVHVMAYAQRFDPDNLMLNFIGDVGASDTLPFSFTVPDGASVLIVAQTNFGLAECAFGVTVDAPLCSAQAPLLDRGSAGLLVVALALAGLLTLRRPRQGAPALLVAALVAGLAGPAVAPLDAAPAPSGRQCLLDCAAAYRSCAHASCDSSNVDRDPDCLQECRAAHLACTDACDDATGPR